MKRLITIFFLFSLAYGQTTHLSFTQIASTTDVVSANRGAEQWNQSPWDNSNDPYIPASNTVPQNWYRRFLWASDIEPGAQGAYVWTTVDAQFQAAINAGQIMEFGVMPMCSGCIAGNLTYPTYLHNLMQAETPPDWFSSVNGSWIPNWNSPSYQARWKALMNACAAHINSTSYKGISFSSVLGYIDVRGYGETGEWNTYPWYGTEPAGTKATAASLDSIISAVGQAFPNTQMVISFGVLDPGNASLTPTATSTYLLNYTNNVGHVGWRRDNMGDPGFDGAEDGNAGILTQWAFAPIGGEPNNDATDAPYGDVPREVTKYKMSYFGNGNWSSVNASNPTFVANARQASLNSGYRIILDTGNITSAPTTGGSFKIVLSIKNLGPAPNYYGWTWTYDLRNGSGTVVWTANSAFSPKLYKPAASDSVLSDTYTLTTVPAGTYSLHLTLKDPLNYRIPMALAITGRNPDGSYTLAASVVVTSSGAPVANAGSNQTITLPTNAVTLDGTGSSGTYSTEAWTQISGPNTAGFGTPNAITTTATGLIQGVYVFQLSLNSGASISTTQVTVNAALPPAQNIFTTQVPAGGTLNDGVGGIEVGVKFKSSISGVIYGVRFYKTTGLTGTHIGELYTSTGTRLAQATYGTETATGWQQVLFSTPVSISAGVTYVATLYSSGGNYADDNNYFGSAITNTNLSTIPNGTSPNGVYIEPTAVPAFPNSNCGGCNGPNYWVDIVFSASRSFIIGTGSGAVSKTSMGTNVAGDTLLIATPTGTYTSLTLKNLNGLTVLPQTVRPTFTTTSGFCNLKNMNIGSINFVAASGTVAIDMSCGIVDSSQFHNFYFQDWSSSDFLVNGGSSALAYIYGVDSTYKQLRNTYDSISEYHCNKLMDGSAGPTGVPKKDVCRELTFSRILDNNTSATSFQGVGVGGICFHCTATNIKITDTSGRGASGDVGWINGTGWWHVTNEFKWGGPGYLIRMFPLCEYRDTGSTWITNSAKFAGTEYGGVSYEYQAVDSSAGQYRGTSGYTYNITIGNQFNDNLGYWSPAVNNGATAPNQRYPVHNIIGFAIGNNNNNNSKPQLIYNLGSWATIATDTSNNQYYTTATVGKFDSTTVLFSTSSGSFPAFYITAITPGRALQGGITNPFATTDYLGNLYRVPPDLGYIQFTGIPSPICLCLPSLHLGFRKVLITR